MKKKIHTGLITYPKNDINVAKNIVSVLVVAYFSIETVIDKIRHNAKIAKVSIDGFLLLLKLT